MRVMPVLNMFGVSALFSDRVIRNDECPTDFPVTVFDKIERVTFLVSGL